MAFGVFFPDRLARSWEKAPFGAVWLAARPRLKRRGLSHAGRAQKARKGSRGDAEARVETPSRRCVRGLDARGCARASSNVVAEVDSWCSGAEKRASSISTDLEAFGDGRLVPGRARESVNDRGRRDAVPDRYGKPHVTVLEIGPCRGNAGTLSMEDTSGHSSGLLFTGRLQMWSWHPRGFALAKASGGSRR
jgi:hypothetical protein